MLCKDGAVQRRCIKRLEKDSAWDKEFLKTCIGSPWNPTGKIATNLPVPAEELPNQSRSRRIYLNKAVLEKYGPTSFCRRCEVSGQPHSEECRRRIEKAMIDAGDAILLGGKREAPTEPSPEVENKKPTKEKRKMRTWKQLKGRSQRSIRL